MGYFVDFEEVVLLPKGECPLKCIKMEGHKWRFILAMFGLWIILTSCLEFYFIIVKPLGIGYENYYMFIMWGNF